MTITSELEKAFPKGGTENTGYTHTGDQKSKLFINELKRSVRKQL